MALVSTRSGRRRYSTRKPALEPTDYSSPTPHDDRVRLPLMDRQVRREVLDNGTVVIHYDDPPLGAEPSSGFDFDVADLPPLPEPPTKSPDQQARELDEKRGLR